MTRSGNKVFGALLTDLDRVPHVFADTAASLRSNARNIPDLWTREDPDLLEKVTLIRRAYDHGLRPLSACRLQDLHAIAGALKLWLQSLPSPLIPPALYAQVLQAVALPEARARHKALRAILLQVGQLNLQILIPLLELLHHTRLNHGPGARAHDGSLPEERLLGRAILRRCGSTGAPPSALFGSGADSTAPAAQAAVQTLIRSYRSIFARNLLAPAGVASPFSAPGGAADPHRTALVGGMRVGTECPHRALGVAARLATALAAEPPAAPAPAAAPQGEHYVEALLEGGLQPGPWGEADAPGDALRHPGEDPTEGPGSPPRSEAGMQSEPSMTDAESLSAQSAPDSAQSMSTSCSSEWSESSESGESGLGSQHCHSPTSVLLDSWHTGVRGPALQKELQLVPLSR